MLNDKLFCGVVGNGLVNVGIVLSTSKLSCVSFPNNNPFASNACAEILYLPSSKFSVSQVAIQPSPLLESFVLPKLAELFSMKLVLFAMLKST